MTGPPEWRVPARVAARRLAGVKEEWQSLGDCAQPDAKHIEFCPDKQELSLAEVRREEARALHLCSTCLVRAECLSYALEADERFGVWGGTTEAQRVKLRKHIKGSLT